MPVAQIHKRLFFIIAFILSFQTCSSITHEPNIFLPCDTLLFLSWISPLLILLHSLYVLSRAMNNLYALQVYSSTVFVHYVLCLLLVADNLSRWMNLAFVVIWVLNSEHISVYFQLIYFTNLKTCCPIIPPCDGWLCGCREGWADHCHATKFQVMAQRNDPQFVKVKHTKYSHILKKCNLQVHCHQFHISSFGSCVFQGTSFWPLIPKPVDL